MKFFLQQGILAGSKPPAEDEGGGGGFDPTSLSGLMYWFKADSLSLTDGDAVDTWSNEGNDSRGDVANTSTARPIYKTGIINGEPVVRFDGVNDRLVTASAEAKPSSVTVYAVFNTDDVSSAAGLLMGQSASNALRGWGIGVPDFFGSQTLVEGRSYSSSGTVRIITANSTTISNSTFYCLAATYSNGDTQFNMKLNGADQTEGTTSTNYNAIEGTAYRFAVGNQGEYSGGFFFDGDLAEVLVYDSVLTGSDLTDVEDYLLGKYGL